MKNRQDKVAGTGKGDLGGSNRRASGSREREVLITGYPGLLAKLLLKKLLVKEPASFCHLLVSESYRPEAESYLRAMGRGKQGRVHLLVGRVDNMHLGFSAKQLTQLAPMVTDIYHLAGLSLLDAADRELWRVHAEGATNMLEFAKQADRLEKFNHLSSCFVSGEREGVICEDELDQGQAFRNSYESSRYEAEIRVRGFMQDLAVSIFRPSIVVGHSTTGESENLETPFCLGSLLHLMGRQVPLPLAGRGLAPLHLVPADFVVNAIYHLSLHPLAVGKTFHLVDPNPCSGRRLMELAAQCLGKNPPVTIRFPVGLVKKVLKLPGIDKLSKTFPQAIAYLHTMSIYHRGNTEELLRGTNVTCPPIESYFAKLVAAASIANQPHANQARFRPESRNA